MNCKHRVIQGRTTKYFRCQIKGKPVDDFDCKNCMLRITDLPEGFEEV